MLRLFPSWRSHRLWRGSFVRKWCRVTNPDEDCWAEQLLFRSARVLHKNAHSLHFPGSTGSLSVKAEGPCADPVTAKSTVTNRGTTLEFSGCFPWEVFQALLTSSSVALSPVIGKEEHYDKCVYTVCYMSTMHCKLAFLISLSKGEVSHTWYLTKSTPIPRMHVFRPMKRQKKILYLLLQWRNCLWGKDCRNFNWRREKNSFLAELPKSWSEASK